jgi:protein involved in polysaccharide export with SLBB domain
MLGSKVPRIWFGAALLMAAVSCGQALNAQEKLESASPGEYRIVVGDVIRIDVWKEPDISRTIPVNAHGNIHLPLIADLKAVDLSPIQLAGLIRLKLEGKVQSAGGRDRGCPTRNDAADISIASSGSPTSASITRPSTEMLRCVDDAPPKKTDAGYCNYRRVTA